MFYSQINCVNDLSYGPIRKGSKKRQLSPNGKENNNNNAKRLKNGMNFHDLPNEIYLEIFDYLCPLSIIHSFYGLNYRLNYLIESIPMKLKFQYLNKYEYKRVLKQIIPKISQQIVGFDFTQSAKTNFRLSSSSSCNSENLFDSFIQSYHLTQFSNLRFLSLTSTNLNQLESLFLIIPNLLSLRSLRLYEQDYSDSPNETVCKLILTNNQKNSINHTHNLTHLYIETSPPFKTLTLLQKHFSHKRFFNSIQINIRCALFFYPQSLTYINYDGLSRLIPNMNYLKMNILYGTYATTFDLIRCFPQIEYLSVKTTSQAYANGYQWANFLSQMSNLVGINLNISLDSSLFNQEFQTFQTNSWLEKNWFIHYRKNPFNSSECQIVYRNINV